jgi:lipoprotein-anchoring transpeptidase ErfK/SrfK
LLLIALALLGAVGGLRAQDGSPASVKRVEIDQTQQILRAYEGDRLVLESRVSTGRGRSTPNGRYRVLDKQRMHYSRLYDNAPMPYSVQIRGHYFIHGFKYVPKRPASHGCIRLPLIGDNPAKIFYEWVELGTPVVIMGRWK